MNSVRTFGVVTSLCLALVGCPPAEQEPAGPATAEHSSATTRWLPLEARGEESWLQAPAVVRAESQAAAEIAASVRAQVRRVHVRAGATVERGDAIVDVAAPQWTDAAAQYQGASRQLEVHAARTQELLGLREKGLVGRADVFAEQARVADLEAQRARAAATLRAAGLAPAESAGLVRRGVVTLHAPAAGVVTEVNAHPGQIREPAGPPFARIQGKAPAHLEVRTVQPWPEGARAHFASTEGQDLALRPEPLSRIVDRRDGTHVTWLAFAQPDLQLTDGLRGLARVVPPDGTWQVPSSALTEGEQGATLHRRRGANQAEVRVEVLSGDGASAWVRAVNAGALAEGDRIAATPPARDNDADEATTEEAP